MRHFGARAPRARHDSPGLPGPLRARWVTASLLLLAVSLAVTLVILVNSRRFVHYAGAK